jgi:hypothetical protein
MRDPADLDAGAVVLQAILQLFNRAVVAVFLHVDEVDDDQSGKVTQAQLAGHFFGCFQVGLQRRVLDRVFAGRLARVDVDGDQRLGLVDDDVAARFERHLRLDHPRRAAARCLSREDRVQVAIGLNHLCVARHQHAHEVFRFAIAFLAGNKDFLMSLL